MERGGWRYISVHERVLPQRRFLTKPPTSLPRFHLHIVEIGTAFWHEHLLFRDYLRRHPEVAQEYYELKVHLAQRYGSDRDGYTEAKTEFIEATKTAAQGELPGASLS